MPNEIESGDRVFIDANIFIYHFTGRSAESKELLRRCQDGEIIGFTSINVLFEVLHLLMMIEAVQKELITPGNVVRKLREKPEVVKQLSDYQTNAMLIHSMGIQVLLPSENIIEESLHFRSKYGLLTNDSLVCALMQTKGIFTLLTADRDFEMVEWISVYVPGDIVS